MVTFCQRRVFSPSFAHTPGVQTSATLIAYASHQLAPKVPDRVPVRKDGPFAVVTLAGGDCSATISEIDFDA